MSMYGDLVNAVLKAPVAPPGPGGSPSLTAITPPFVDPNQQRQPQQNPAPMVAVQPQANQAPNQTPGQPPVAAQPLNAGQRVNAMMPYLLGTKPGNPQANTSIAQLINGLVRKIKGGAPSDDTLSQGVGALNQGSGENTDTGV